MKEEKYEQLHMGFEEPEVLTEAVVVPNKLDLREALLKRAVGFVSEERVDEYAVDSLTSSLRLIKRKIVRKDVPPDVMAAKVLMDAYSIDSVKSMTDEELEAEKNRLLELLKQEEIRGGDYEDRK